MDVYKQIFKKLQSKGLNIYSPGQHQGLCNKSYLVIKNMGSSPFAGNKVASYSIFDVIVYHPMSQYSSFESYINTVKIYLKEMKELRWSGDFSSTIDSEKNAHMMIIRYQVFKGGHM